MAVIETVLVEMKRQSRMITRTLKEVVASKNVSMEKNKTLHDNVSLPTLIYGSKAWTMLKG